MKFVIRENKVDNIVFKYLDLTLKGLEKRKAKYYDGIIFAYPDPDEEYGVLGYKNYGTLYIYYKLIDEISNIFPLKRTEFKKLIGRWVSDRYQLEVKNTLIDYEGGVIKLAIDTN